LHLTGTVVAFTIAAEGSFVSSNYLYLILLQTNLNEFFFFFLSFEFEITK